MSKTPNSGLASTRKALEGLLDLPQGWDGDDAAPFSREIVANAISLATHFDILCNRARLNTMPPEAEVSAVDGEIRLDWDHKNHTLTLIVNNKSVPCVYIRKPGNIRSFRVSGDPRKTADILFHMWKSPQIQY